MPRSDDDELTDPHMPIGMVDIPPCAAFHFRCSRCELETLTDEAVSSAPRCPNCDRFMAPVNSKRGVA